MTFSAPNRLLLAGLLWLLPACSLFGFFDTPPQRCEAGAIQVRDCTDELGHEGEQERLCRNDGRWSDWSPCESGSCEPGLVEQASCEPRGGIPMQRSRVCQDDGTWSDWSDCASIERCTDGAERVRRQPCGPCGLGHYVDSCHEGHWEPYGCRDNPYDLDGDGFGNDECFESTRPGAPACCGERDCDDTCPQCFPGGEEVPGNDLDEDCSGRASDMDDDGLLATEEGGEDCLDRDPRRSSEEADLDGDGHLALGCGGEDCDDDCPTCHPGAEPACGEARDHDCDGVVDELGGCGGCAPGTPRVVASVPIASDVISAIWVSGGYAYVAHSGGLTVLDVSTPESPTEAGTTMGTQPPRDVFLRGRYAYIADGRGVAVMDISTPDRPVVFDAGHRLAVPAYRLFVAGSLAFTVAAELSARETIQVFDVSMPDRPLPLRRFDDESPGALVLNALFVARGTIFAAADRIYAMDTSDMTGWSGSFHPTGSGEDMFWDIVVRDELAYVAGDSGIFIVDATDPGEMELASSFTRMGSWRSLFVAGDFLYVTGQQANAEGSRFMVGLHLFDVSDPRELVELLSVEDVPIQDVFVSGGYAYVAGDEPPGLFVIDLDCGGP